MKKHTLKIYYNTNGNTYFNYKGHRFYTKDILYEMNFKTMFLDYSIGTCYNVDIIYGINDYIVFDN